MALSINSTLKELLADERAKVILRTAMNTTEEAFNEVVNAPQMQQAMGMSFKQLAGFSKGEITEEMLSAAEAEFAKL